MGSPEENAVTLRAAAEVFVPGPPHDPTPGAADVHAELFISHYLDFLIPGLAQGLPDLLNELSATTYEGRSFVDLSLEERTQVFDLLATHDVEQLRELPLVIGLLSMAARAAERSRPDAAGALTRRPPGWP